MISDDVIFKEGAAKPRAIFSHLSQCASDFTVPLQSRIDLRQYADKIRDKATTFEAWCGASLVGLVAAYLNDPGRRSGYITNVSVSGHFTGRGIASELLRRCIACAMQKGFQTIVLETDKNNHRAYAVYRECGFRTFKQKGRSRMMKLNLKRRLYNTEIMDLKDRKYAYAFDFEVMHPYIFRSFEPFFRKGNMLELGSFKGGFTRKLLTVFEDVTCVEASSHAMKTAKALLGRKVTFIHSPFERATLPVRYDHIVMMHVLEHLDNPVGMLRKINREWLSDEGRLFLVCPNANAPSRQIAVKMGLISHPTAVTRAEQRQGHRRTYTLDTLERDATLAGLKVVHRSGIFFKALANFQWDKLLAAEIISREYLDGCYQLGLEYPELCASIFLLCERGS